MVTMCKLKIWPTGNIDMVKKKSKQQNPHIIFGNQHYATIAIQRKKIKFYCTVSKTYTFEGIFYNL